MAKERAREKEHRGIWFYVALPKRKETDLTTIHSLQLRKVFFASVLSIDTTCLSWCVELAALEFCSASFQRDLYAQVDLLCS